MSCSSRLRHSTAARFPTYATRPPSRALPCAILIAILAIACGGGTGSPAAAPPERTTISTAAAPDATPSSSPATGGITNTPRATTTSAPLFPSSTPPPTTPPTGTSASSATPAPPAPPPPIGGAETVTILAFIFTRPASVPAGSTVTWVNRDSDQHNVVALDGSFASPLLEMSQTFSHRFGVPGIYQYLCSIHPDMRQTITVR